jgi:hypothetical protein
MTFQKIDSGTSCKCVDASCKENTQEVFSRKIGGDVPDENDFRSYWELGWPPGDLNNCVEICLKKGVSVDLCNDRNKILEHYKTTIGLKPRVGAMHKAVCFLRFQKDAGVFRKKNHKKNTHRTFFKCDGFQVASCIIVIDIVPLND